MISTDLLFWVAVRAATAQAFSLTSTPSTTFALGSSGRLEAGRFRHVPAWTGSRRIERNVETTPDPRLKHQLLLPVQMNGLTLSPDIEMAA
jgi:hypothetical protein